MDKVAISTNLTLEDWRALQLAAARRLRRSETPPRQWLRLLGLVVLFAAAFFVGVALLGGGTPFDVKSVAAGVFVVLAATLISWRVALRRMAPAPNGIFLGPCTYELDATGLRSSRGASHSFASWSAIIDVTRADAHVFIWIDRFAAYVLPCRDLPEWLAPELFADWIAAAWAGAPARAALPEQLGIARQAAAAARAAPARLRPRLLELASLVALRGKPALLGPSHGRMAVLVTLLALATWAALNRFENGPDAAFYVYGIPTVAWYLLGGLAVAWLLARGSVPRIALSRAVTVSALGAWLVVLYWYLADWVPSTVVAALLLVGGALYALAYFARATRALTGEAQPRAVLAAFVATLVFFWSSGALYIYPTVWVPNEYDGEGEPAYASYEDVEPLLFAQHERVDAALAAVRPSNPAATELYFVGFAGYGEQKVFAEEIKFAARTVAERYASGARSVLLLNDERDFDTAPLATTSTLRYALQGIAARMTLDDDVLFLALSSHGSSEWTIAVSNGALPLADLTPAQLRSALDDAGIRWRVIVISACYAGGFIETLQDPNTIVLAAAAPDRTSFGCSDERDLTYFGEAFYRDALPGSASLRDAFATAERLVGERETAEAVTPSLPMAFYGDEIERKLAALERRFEVSRAPGAERE